MWGCMYRRGLSCVLSPLFSARHRDSEGRGKAGLLSVSYRDPTSLSKYLVRLNTQAPSAGHLACGPGSSGDELPALTSFSLLGSSRPLSAASSTIGTASTSGPPCRTSTAPVPSAGSVGMRSCTPIGTGTSLVSASSGPSVSPLLSLSVRLGATVDLLCPGRPRASQCTHLRTVR